MRGLIKGGIKYISHMFDEKEPEMEIGLPTDVKHVAHIGWEGPDASKPSWMNGFHNKPAPELETENFNSLDEDVSGIEPNSTGLETRQREKKHRASRSSASANSPMNSPGRKSNDGTQYSMNSSPKHNRRHRSSTSPKQSPGRDPSAAPKHSRPRKSKKDKNSSKDGSEASKHKSKHVKKSYASHLSSVLEAYEDEPKQHTDHPKSTSMMTVENSEFQTPDAKAECIGVCVS